MFLANRQTFLFPLNSLRLPQIRDTGSISTSISTAVDSNIVAKLQFQPEIFKQASFKESTISRKKNIRCSKMVFVAQYERDGGLVLFITQVASWSPTSIRSQQK
jgi:hypothetical protein